MFHIDLFLFELSFSVVSKIYFRWIVHTHIIGNHSRMANGTISLEVSHYSKVFVVVALLVPYLLVAFFMQSPS